MPQDKNYADRLIKSSKTESIDTIRGKITQSKIDFVVSKILDKSDVFVNCWNIETMSKGMSGGDLFKLHGKFENDLLNEWSVVLKILYREKSPQGLTQYDWNREALVYQSGLVDSIPGGFEAAICYSIDEISEEEVWIWLEDLSEYNEEWSLERYALAAYHLGQMNGYFSQNHLPDEPWLMRSYEKQAVNRDINIEQYRQFRDHPLVQEVIPSDKSKIIEEIYYKYLIIVNRLSEQMPQTFGHMDGFRGNLFSRTKADGDISTIGIDWAFSGINPLGYELKILVYQSLGFQFIDPKHAIDLDKLSFNGYLEGLKNVGWSGNEDHVRYGYLWISMMTFLRFVCILPPMWIDETKHVFFERIIDKPFREIHKKSIGFWAFQFELATEALDLDSKLF